MNRGDWDDPASHPETFAAHTLSLSRIGGTRSNKERAAWLRGFIAGASTIVFGSIGVAFLLALAQSL